MAAEALDPHHGGSGRVEDDRNGLNGTRILGHNRDSKQTITGIIILADLEG